MAGAPAEAGPLIAAIGMAAEGLADAAVDAAQGAELVEPVIDEPMQ